MKYEEEFDILLKIAFQQSVPGKCSHQLRGNKCQTKYLFINLTLKSKNTYHITFC